VLCTPDSFEAVQQALLEASSMRSVQNGDASEPIALRDWPKRRKPCWTCSTGSKSSTMCSEVYHNAAMPAEAAVSAAGRLPCRIALSSMIRIIGIDPGSQRTGVGIIDVDAAGKLTMFFMARWLWWAKPRFPCA
jgi:hypothetical protein